MSFLSETKGLLTFSPIKIVTTTTTTTTISRLHLHHYYYSNNVISSSYKLRINVCEKYLSPIDMKTFQTSTIKTKEYDTKSKRETVQTRQIYNTRKL